MTRWRIRPTGWADDVEAWIDDESWEATYFDDVTQVTWSLPYGQYTALECLDDGLPPVAEPKACTCTSLALFNVGCRCGAVEPYRVPR